MATESQNEDVERIGLVYRAKLAEQAERYDEMSDFMKEVAMMNEELSVEERNLLSVAYKNAVGARRASWRIVSSVESKQRGKGNSVLAKYAAEYCQPIEEELRVICGDILMLLQMQVDKSKKAECKVFYHKMRGDYYRYIAEFSAEKNRDESTQNSLGAYQKATEVATKDLGAAHPVRLGLALNFSVFYYEIVGKPDKACALAQQAFDDAVGELDNIAEESYRDSTLIMQLLRDNLTLWIGDTAGDKNESQAAPPAANDTTAPVAS